MNTNTKIKRLSELIKEAKLLRFNNVLIFNYENNLNELLQIREEEKAKNKELTDLMNNPISNIPKPIMQEVENDISTNRQEEINFIMNTIK